MAMNIAIVSTNWDQFPVLVLEGGAVFRGVGLLLLKILLQRITTTLNTGIGGSLQGAMTQAVSRSSTTVTQVTNTQVGFWGVGGSILAHQVQLYVTEHLDSK